MLCVRRFAASSFDRKRERARIVASGRWHIVPEPFDRALLTKWALVALTRYELVLSLDNDIDLYEVGRRNVLGMSAYLSNAARVWATELSKFRDSPARMLGTPDAESPTNMGMIWLKPSRAYYDEGIALLRENRFSVELGFNSTGRPHDLMPPDIATDEAVAKTRMMWLNSWNIVAGSSDQGLFTLIFTMRHRALMLTSRPDYQVHHYWSSSKPWMRIPSCLPYFYALGLVDEPGDEPGRKVPPRLLPLPGGKGLCYRLLRQKASMVLTGLQKRWGCRGANFKVFRR